MKPSPRSKLKQTLPTFLILIISLVALYFFARWVYGTVLKKPIDLVLWELYIPILFPVLPGMYFINRKLNSFANEVPRRSRFALTFFTLATATGMMLTLGNMAKESDEMMAIIPDITKLDTAKTVKYFKIKQYSVNKYGGHHFRYTRSQSSRKNQLVLNLYMALPLLKYPNEPIKEFPMKWYGLKFSMTVNPGRSEESKRALEQEFLKESQQKIEAMTFDNEDYFELISPSEGKEWYVNAVNSIPISRPQYRYQILKPYFNSFNQKAMTSLYWSLGIFLFGTLLFSLELLYPRHIRTQDQTQPK